MLALPHFVGLGIFAVEIGHSIGKRSGADRDARKDRGSFWLVWIAATAGVVAAIWVCDAIFAAHFEIGPIGIAAALACIVSGSMLRWWAVATLGRLFTVDVAIREGHELVTRGPFRFVRHPSYTGLLMMFVGWALTFQNAWSIVALLLPLMIALSFRIHVEESALASAFGPRYAEYRARTKRLIPGIY